MRPTVNAAGSISGNATMIRDASAAPAFTSNSRWEALPLESFVAERHYTTSTSRSAGGSSSGEAGRRLSSIERNRRKES